MKYDAKDLPFRTETLRADVRPIQFYSEKIASEFSGFKERILTEFIPESIRGNSVLIQEFLNDSKAELRIHTIHNPIAAEEVWLNGKLAGVFKQWVTNNEDGLKFTWSFEREPE